MNKLEHFWHVLKIGLWAGIAFAALLLCSTQSLDPATDFTYSIDSNQVTITGYKGTNATINIPNYIEGYPVTTIGAWAFDQVSVMKNVNLPDTLTTIRFAASHSCGIKEITIPASVTLIEDYVFAFTAVTNIAVAENNSNYCSVDGILFTKDMSTLLSYPTGNARTEYTVPDSVKCLYIGAFKSSQYLERIIISANTSTIGGTQFGACPKLVSIEVAEDNPNYCSVDGVFFNKNKTTLLDYPHGKTQNFYDFPDGVTTIGSCAFEGSSYLQTVTLPESLMIIGDYAFAGCSALSSIIIPNSVTRIGSYAFQHCTSATSLKLSSLITKIEEGTFRYCTSLPYVIIPDSVAEIGNEAFLGCSSLTTIVFGKGVEILDEIAFYQCTAKKDIYFTSTVPPTLETLALNCPGTIYYPAGAAAWTSPWNGRLINPYNIYIFKQPKDFAILAGENATLSVEAFSGYDLFYQWYKYGVAIAGASNASYTISDIQMSDAGNYRVKVSNEYGEAITDAAMINIPRENTYE